MNIKILYTITVALALVKLTVPLPFIDNLTVVCLVLMVFCFTMALLLDKRCKISQPLLLLCFFSLLGLFINCPPAHFRSSNRYLMFVLSLAILSPLIVSESLNKVRIMLFKVTMIGLRLIVIASFIAFLLNVNLAEESTDDVMGAFGGITNQSMTLAPIVAICFLETVYRLLYLKMSAWRRWWLVALLIMALWLIFVAGSRISLVGCLLATLPLLYYHMKKAKIILSCLVIAGIVTLALPQSTFDLALYTINRKQASAAKLNSWSSSRDSKWEARWAEFTESPVLGVGFGVQTHFTEDDDLGYIRETGGLEPGSSWLSVLSMTGLLGFVCIFILNFNLYKGTLRRCRDDVESILFISWLLFFFIQGCAEGWIFYAGSYTFFLYWLLTGVMNIKVNGGNVLDYSNHV